MSLLQLQSGGGQTEQSRPGIGRPSNRMIHLVLLFACLLAGAFACQSFLDSLFFARLQIKRVTFHFFNDVFLLHLALETAQGIFEGLTLLQSYFSQSGTPPNWSWWTG